MLKLNNSDQYESIKVILSEEKHSQVFENKVKCLMLSGLSEEEAKTETRKWFSNGIELEVYYEPGYGLFAVEPDAVESGTIYSPYSGELAEDSDIYF